MGLNQFGDFIELDPDQYFTNFVDPDLHTINAMDPLNSSVMHRSY